MAEDNKIFVKKSIGVLLVSGDEALCLIMRDTLDALGFRVLMMLSNSPYEKLSDGEYQALELYRRRHREIDVIVMDSRFVIYNDYWLIRHLQRINPQVKVILATSLHMSQEEVERGWRAGVSGWLNKPISIQKLKAEIDRVLGD